MSLELVVRGIKNWLRQNDQPADETKKPSLGVNPATVDAKDGKLLISGFEFEHPTGCQIQILNQLFKGTDQGSQSFGQEACIKRLFESLIDGGSVERNWLTIIGKQSDQNRFGKIGILA